MTNAPERIWIEDEFGEGDEDQWNYGTWDVRNYRGYVVEYVRADTVQALTAERDRLREALESLHGFADGWRECGCGDSCYGRHAERNMVLDHLHDFATAALKGESHE